MPEAERPAGHPGSERALKFFVYAPGGTSGGAAVAKAAATAAKPKEDGDGDGDDPKSASFRTRKWLGLPAGGAGGAEAAPSQRSSVLPSPRSQPPLPPQGPREPPGRSSVLNAAKPLDGDGWEQLTSPRRLRGMF